jgi:hypothetical protein
VCLLSARGARGCSCLLWFAGLGGVERGHGAGRSVVEGCKREDCELGSESAMLEVLGRLVLYNEGLGEYESRV